VDANKLKLIAFAALLSLTLAAQSPAPALPNFAGVGSIYSTTQSPKWSGWAALGLPVSQTGQVYSFTLYQAVPVTGKVVPTISTTTGLATIMRTFKASRGTLFIIALGTAGVSTSTTATTGAFAGGGGAFFKMPSGLVLEVVGIQNKAAGSTSPEILAGLGFAWGGK
jgi:hypothetical protein